MDSIYHSTITNNKSAEEKGVSNAIAIGTLAAYRLHLAHSWPSLKDEIELGFIKGSNGTEICISHSLGWENEDWLSFLHCGIALPVALENCRKSGIRKFVFYCNDEIMEMTTEELIRMANSEE
jgi:hypothetical protein